MQLIYTFPRKKRGGAPVLQLGSKCYTMNEANQNSGEEKDQPKIEVGGEPLKENVSQKIDEEVEQSFPASDPPSYSKPGNDDIKPGKEDVKEGR